MDICTDQPLPALDLDSAHPDAAANRDAVIAEMERRGPEKFSMAAWFRGPGGDGIDHGLTQAPGGPTVFINQCGTTACLAGFACSVMSEDEYEAVATAGEITMAERAAYWLGVPEAVFYWGAGWRMKDLDDESLYQVQEKAGLAAFSKLIEIETELDQTRSDSEREHMTIITYLKGLQ